MGKRVKKHPPKDSAIRSVAEVAAIVGVSRARVWQLERRAFQKLRNSPMLRTLFQEVSR